MQLANTVYIVTIITATDLHWCLSQTSTWIKVEPFLKNPFNKNLQAHSVKSSSTKSSGNLYLKSELLSLRCCHLPTGEEERRGRGKKQRPEALKNTLKPSFWPNQVNLSPVPFYRIFQILEHSYKLLECQFRHSPYAWVYCALRWAPLHLADISQPPAEARAPPPQER